KFKCCTILFSDIVTFTNIASQCSPMQVVNMLNSLYSLFDKACARTTAYKTIGDAYMVVGGVPEPDDRHAEIIAEQAMLMMIQASEVCSPATGKPLQIRVGMHSGPVVTGVVGERMPRYCLFGDTVNVASRMESHSIPGHIHCSNTTYELLKSSKYEFVPRGPTEIKGKGVMQTYFLKSDGETVLDCNVGDISTPQLEAIPNGNAATEQVNVTCGEKLRFNWFGDHDPGNTTSKTCIIS
ncbi:Guanylate cyclase soluble subunit beta-2, partial [Cichlidogyrus casuarinus]